MSLRSAPAPLNTGSGGAVEKPFADSIRVLGPKVAGGAIVVVVVIAFFVSVPGVSSDVLRPIDLIGILMWAVALSGRGGRLARMLLLIGIVVVTVAIAGIWLYPQSVVGTQFLLSVRYLSVFGALAAVYVARVGPKQGRRLLALCAAAITASCVSAIVGYQTGNRGTYAHQTFQDGNVGGLVHRLGGWVGESGAYGALAVVAGFAIAIALARTRFRTLGYVGALALLLTSYALSLARVCLIATAVMIVAIMIAERRRVSFWLIFLPFTIAAVLVARAAGVLPGLTPQSLARLDFSGGNLTSGRTEHWQAIFENLGQTGALFTGTGVRGVGALFHLPTENLFVAAIADFGIIFGVVFLVIIGKMWLDFLRDASAIPDAATAIMTKGLLIAVLLQWMFNDVTAYFQAFPLFAITLGAALSLGSPKPDALDAGPKAELGATPGRH